MSIKLGISSVILATAILALAARPAPGAPLNVTLDPGHGGKDYGAVQGKMRESVLTLQISERLAQLLQDDSRFTVNLTRKEDTFIGLEQRVARAHAKNAEVFLSIHVNWSKDSRAHGLEVYFQNQLPPNEESMYLAARENQGEASADNAPVAVKIAKNLSPEIQLILQDLANNQKIITSSQLAKSLTKNWHGDTKPKSLSVRQAPFFVISNLQVPSALVEIGFLSNPQEGPKLAAANYQEVIATSLFDGLIHYKDSLDKEQASRLH